MKPPKGFIPIAGVRSSTPIDTIALPKGEEEQVSFDTLWGGKLTHDQRAGRVDF